MHFRECILHFNVLKSTISKREDGTERTPRVYPTSRRPGNSPELSSIGGWPCPPSPLEGPMRPRPRTSSGSSGRGRLAPDARRDTPAREASHSRTSSGSTTLVSRTRALSGLTRRPSRLVLEMHPRPFWPHAARPAWTELAGRLWCWRATWWPRLPVFEGHLRSAWPLLHL